MSGPDQKKVGARIREIRTEQGMSQEDLAKRANISAVYLSRIEHGNTDVGLELLKRVAEALGVLPAALIGEPAQLSKEAIAFGKAFDQAPSELQAAILNFLATLDRERGQS